MDIRTTIYGIYCTEVHSFSKIVIFLIEKSFWNNTKTTNWNFTKLYYRNICRSNGWQRTFQYRITHRVFFVQHEPCRNERNFSLGSIRGLYNLGVRLEIRVRDFRTFKTVVEFLKGWVYIIRRWLYIVYIILYIVILYFTHDVPSFSVINKYARFNSSQTYSKKTNIASERTTVVVPAVS